jgi:hypothetical protein
MKKIATLVGFVCLLTVVKLTAAMQVTLMDDTSQYSYSNGGEFRAVPNSALLSQVDLNAYSASAGTTGTISQGTDGNSWGYNSGMIGHVYFQTFCVEYNEEFTPGTTYSVGISSRAMYGSQPPLGDPISIGTAWLYSQFAAGTLAGYSYTYGTQTGQRATATSAGALQQAIWWLEGEQNGARNSFIDTAEKALYSGHTGGVYDDMIRANANGAYDVAVLNLGAPGEVQDQLVIAVPEPSTVLGGAFLLIPFGLSAIGLIRRRLGTPRLASLLEG